VNLHSYPALCQEINSSSALEARKSVTCEEFIKTGMICQQREVISRTVADLLRGTFTPSQSISAVNVCPSMSPQEEKSFVFMNFHRAVAFSTTTEGGGLLGKWSVAKK
jgi:hypothetical protein